MIQEEGLEYAIVIEPLPAGEGGGFLARVPELPGCCTDRETLAEARRLGREPPAPKSYSLAG
jgi:predicted RNase H-like HicB family nuclease